MSNNVIGTLSVGDVYRFLEEGISAADNSKSPSRPILGYMQVIVEGNILLVHSADGYCLNASEFTLEGNIDANYRTEFYVNRKEVAETIKRLKNSKVYKKDYWRKIDIDFDRMLLQPDDGLNAIPLVTAPDDIGSYPDIEKLFPSRTKASFDLNLNDLMRDYGKVAKSFSKNF